MILPCDFFEKIQGLKAMDRNSRAFLSRLFSQAASNGSQESQEDSSLSSGVEELALKSPEFYESNIGLQR